MTKDRIVLAGKYLNFKIAQLFKQSLNKADDGICEVFRLLWIYF